MKHREPEQTWKNMMKTKTFTDEWGVTYNNYGRVLKVVNPKLFTCEEYNVPEGVEEVMDDAFLLSNPALRKIHLPETLRKLGCNTFHRFPLEEIELPEGITEVPDCMCEGCQQLRKVVLPSSVRTIKIGAFNCCQQLHEINLPDNIDIIEDEAFRYCESLKQIVLPPKLRYLSPELFYGSGIETIEIPESITEICYWAFWGCDNLKSLTIPASVKSIRYGIVSAHEGFEGIECHAKGYHVENEALIDDENQELLCCWTTQKHYVVPECVKKIGDMGGNKFVETITVRQPVELRSREIFASDTGLRSIRFLGGVSGEKQDFWNCPNLEQPEETNRLINDRNSRHAIFEAWLESDSGIAWEDWLKTHTK